MYVTDVMRLACENLARSVPEGGSYISVRWSELIEHKAVDERSADEIALDIITRAGLKIGGETG